MLKSVALMIGIYDQSVHLATLDNCVWRTDSFSTVWRDWRVTMHAHTCTLSLMNNNNSTSHWQLWNQHCGTDHFTCQATLLYCLLKRKCLLHSYFSRYFKVLNLHSISYSMYAHYCGISIKVNSSYSSVVAYMILGFPLNATLI
jgi:hypothetical protein